LYSDAGYTTQINNGDFIASGGATTNVYFRPTANRNSTTGGDGAFTVQASKSGVVGGLAGSTATSTITLTPVADTPSVASPTVNEDTDSGAIAITRSAVDGAETTHYQITGITGGTLYSDAGYTTQINNGDFIASGGATTNVYFRPTANRNSTTGGDGAFTVQASKSNLVGGLAGSTATSTITLTPVADTPSVTDANTTSGIQTASGLVLSRSAVDGVEVTHFKITGITNGNLFLADGTTAVNDGDFITFAQGNAGLKFTPTGGGNGAFTAQASTTGADGGLGGSTVTATITVGAAVASPTINEDADSGAIAISQGGAETHYKITGITGGTLYSDAGYTTQINDGDFIACAGATTNVYFRPTAERNTTTGGNGSFVVQTSSSSADGGLFGAQITSTITLTPVADTPSVASPTIDEDTDSGAIAITRSAVDGAETTHYQITGITGGTLYSDAGYTTQINNGDFIASGGATTNVYFRPTANRNSTTGGDGAFTVQASKSGVVGGLAGSTATSTITLTPVADTPSVASPTIDEDADSGAIAITRAAGDGAETTHYQITGITGGTLYSDAGYTTQINNGDFIASAGATTNVYFRPTANRNSTTGGDGAFTVQASKSNVVGGLAGSTATSTITLTPVADTPSVASPTIDEDTDSGAIAIMRSAVDGAETTHYQITGITGGTLYSDAGYTTQINNGDFIASGGATTN
ncbi:MAG: hypothetical protein OEL88_16945, partial [Sterolibacteriaceae bacterium MAG5]|nr:hypothetical protein [Candidatus Nitricoxidireducens bremensis]